VSRTRVGSQSFRTWLRDGVRKAAAGAVALATMVAFLVAGAVTCQTRNWQPVTVGDFQRTIHATADRKEIIDHSAGAVDLPQPDPPPPPALTERIPPAVPRKEDDEA
jgi:hypothetical protein